MGYRSKRLAYIRCIGNVTVGGEEDRSSTCSIGGITEIRFCGLGRTEKRKLTKLSRVNDGKVARHTGLHIPSPIVFLHYPQGPVALSVASCKVMACYNFRLLRVLVESIECHNRQLVWSYCHPYYGL